MAISLWKMPLKSCISLASILFPENIYSIFELIPDIHRFIFLWSFHRTRCSRSGREGFGHVKGESRR